VSDLQWYILKNGERNGPFSQTELRSRAESGLLDRDALVWRDGLTDWVAAGTIKGLFLAPPPAPTSPLRLTWWQSLFRTQQPRTKAGTDAVVPPINQKPTKRAANVDKAANRKMVSQLREDATDIQLVYAELFRITLQRRFVGFNVGEFTRAINSITDATPRPETARIVQLAIQSVNLENVVAKLDDAFGGVAALGGTFIQKYEAGLKKAWPKAGQYIHHSWIDNPDKASEVLRETLLARSHRFRSEFDELEQHFMQLQEFLPRYQTLMSRSDFWKNNIRSGLGLAAYVIGGQIGLGLDAANWGAKLWNDWRAKSDTAFCESFEDGLLEFRDKLRSLIEKLENEVEVYISAFVNEFHTLQVAVVAFLESFVGKIDLSRIYHELRQPIPGEKYDDERQSLLELMISSLSDRRVSTRSVANIRMMLDIP